VGGEGERLGKKGSEFRVEPETTIEHEAATRIPVRTHRDRPFEDELDLQLQDHVERTGATPEAGEQAARRTAHLYQADDLRGLLLEFAYAWNMNGLGTVSFESEAGCDLRIARCWSCYGPGPGCGFVSAYLRTLLEAKMGFAYDVAESACTTVGDDACRFAIRLSEVAESY